MGSLKDLFAEKAARGSSLVWLENFLMGKISKNYVTKEECRQRLSEITTDSTSAPEGAYLYKGQVDDYASLPTAEMTDETIGWTYDAKDTGMNWAWNGEGWDNLGALYTFDMLTEDELAWLFGTALARAVDYVGSTANVDYYREHIKFTDDGESNIYLTGGVPLGHDTKFHATNDANIGEFYYTMPIQFNLEPTENVTVKVIGSTSESGDFSTNELVDVMTPEEFAKGVTIPFAYRRDGKVNKFHQGYEYKRVRVTITIADTTHEYIIHIGDGFGFDRLTHSFWP